MRHFVFLIIFLLVTAVGTVAAYNRFEAVRQNLDRQPRVAWPPLTEFVQTLPFELPFIEKPPPFRSNPTCQLAEVPLDEDQCVIEVGILNRFTAADETCFSGGVEHLRGYEMALKDINKKIEAGGEAMSCQLSLVPFDIYDQTVLPDRIKQYAEEDAALLIGAYSSGETLIAAQAAQFRQIPLLVPTATNELITALGNDWVFRINATGADLIEPPLDLLTTIQPLPTVGLLYENTVFGEGVATSFLTQANNRDFVITVNERFQPGILSTGIRDVDDMWRSIGRANPTVLFVVSSRLDDALAILERRQRSDAPEVYVGVAGIFTSPTLLEQAGENARRLLVTAQWSRDVPWQLEDGTTPVQFYERYQEEYPGEPMAARTVQTYTTLMVAHDVIAACEDFSTVKNIRICIRSTLRAYQKDETLFGQINFNNTTGQNEHEPLLVEVVLKDGTYQFATVFPLKYAVKEFTNE